MTNFTPDFCDVLVRCKDCKYAQIMKTSKKCLIDFKDIQVLVPRDCPNFEVKE